MENGILTPEEIKKGNGDIEGTYEDDILCTEITEIGWYEKIMWWLQSILIGCFG